MRTALVFIFLAASAIIIVLSVAAASATAGTCITCCCPNLLVTPELHSMVSQAIGEDTPDDFTSSLFTGQQQRKLPSSSFVTVVAEPAWEATENGASLPIASRTASNNCSWVDPTRLHDNKTVGRCALETCTSHWLNNPVTWSLAPREGAVLDLLATGERAVTPTVKVDVDESFDFFQRRMSMSTAVRIGAVYAVADTATCRAVPGLACHHSHFWFLPRSGELWVTDISTPYLQPASTVVEAALPLCDDILDAVLRNASALAVSGSDSDSDSDSDLATTQWLMRALEAARGPAAGGAPKGTKNRAVALSRPNRVLCAHRSQQRNTTTMRHKNVVEVVPIDKTKSDVAFLNQARLTSCVSNHFHPQPGVCSPVFAQPGDGTACGAFQIDIDPNSSLLLTAFVYIGLGVALVSSCALLLGASAVMIAVDAQLLAVIMQGTCSTRVGKPATMYLQQFLFLGRAVAEENNTVEFYAGIVGWLVGLVSVVIFLHGALVVVVSIVRRSFYRAARARQAAIATASGDAAAKESSASAAASKKKNDNDQDSAQQKQSIDSSTNGGSAWSFLERIFGMPNNIGAGGSATQGGKGFALEERRILARTAALLHFPSASLVVLLAALQGLWFAAVNVWWYSTTALESMPGIVGGLFALLLTLIVLVLARQTRLIFNSYTWLHPERAETDAREQAIEVSAAVAARSLFTIKRSWFFPYGSWGPARPRQRMGMLFLPVKSRAWIGVPFLVSIVTCLAISVYPLTLLGCCAQQMFLAMFFFGIALVVWKSQPMRSPYANTMFVAVRGALAVMCFCRTIVLVTEDEYFDAIHFLLAIFIEGLILLVGVIDIWCGLAEYFVWQPHLEYRQEIIRARTGGALRLQREREDEQALGDANDDGDGDGYDFDDGDDLGVYAAARRASQIVRDEEADFYCEMADI